MKAVRLVAVPYDSGHRGERQGLGPASLVEHWLASPEERSRLPNVVWVESETDFPTEVATTFELIGRVAEVVRGTLDDGHFPVVLAGNCNSSALGGAAGLRLWDQRGDVGVVWFDTHGDFNTPEIDPRGFLDGQGLAILTGRCWQGPARHIPGFEPLADSSVMLIGGHDLDDDERIALGRSEIVHVTPSQIRREGVEAALGPAVGALAQRVTRVYLHVDLDVVDADYARANSYAAPGGLEPDQLFEATSYVIDHLPIAAAGLAAYDPSMDGAGRVRGVATQMLNLLRQAAGTPPSLLDWDRSVG